MIAISKKQALRVQELYSMARTALYSLADESLNLDFDANAALDAARAKLEEFDACVMQQPVRDEL